MRLALLRHAWLLCGLLLWWAYATSAVAAQTIKMSNVVRGAEVLDGTVEIWQRATRLPGQDLEPQKVADLPGDAPEGFRTVTAEQLQQRQNLPMWLRLALHNDLPDTETARLALQVTWLQHVDFHVRRTSQGQVTWTLTRAGVSDPRDSLYSLDRVPQVAIDLEPGETVQVLARVDNNTRASPLNIGLYADNQWLQAERNHALISGLLIGGLLIFAVYSTALWQIARTATLAWQTLGLTLTMLYEANYRGYTRMLLWPDSLEWSYRANQTFAAGIILSLLLYLNARLRQNTTVRLPAWSLRMLQVIAAVETIVLVGSLTGPYAWIAPLGIFMAPTAMIAISTCTYLYYRRGGRGAKAALLIMFMLCVCALLRMMWLQFPTTSFVRIIDQYVLVLPGILISLFVFTSWSYRQLKQSYQAQRTLLQWQDQQQQYLELEVQRKTRALGVALAQAEQREQEQKELLAYVSHDLRAPLSTILGNLRLMPADAISAGGDKLAAIERSTIYQLALIDELVDYAKQDLRPLLALDEQPTNLRTLLEDLSQYAQALASRQRNSFTLQAHGTLPEQVYLDSKRLQQAVLNLLSNAAKFTHDGHIRLWLWAEAVDGGNGDDAAQGPLWRLHFEVMDSGSGISQAELASMTQALAGKMPQARGGLGLLIAQRIVQQMQGQLSLESQLGAGTRAAFFLQLRQVPGSATFEPEAAPATTAGQRGPAARALPALSPQQKQDLEALAVQGNWSDLHAWLDALSRDGHFQQLVQAVLPALERLDFEQIRQIARAAPTKPN